MTFYQPALAEDHIRLHTDFPDEPIDVRLNRQRLRQVLLNLLKNAAFAIRECDDGHITLD